VPAAQSVHDLVVYAALPQGTYRYDPKAHALVLVAAADLRRVTGYQDFVDHAPLDLIYVADPSAVAPMTAAQRESYAWVEAGAIAQNVYLYCSAYGLGAVLRAWLDRDAVGRALGLHARERVLLSQTVGYPMG
jgi:SagB-type dehydrogenase family enzyme